MKRPEISIKQNRKTIPLDRYAGEWVAFASGRVVAHQSTLKKLMKRVERLRKRPSVFLVPKKTEGNHIL